MWDSFVQDSGGLGVFGQRFDGIGRAARLRVPGQHLHDRTRRRRPRSRRPPTAASSSSGRAHYQDGSGAAVFGQRFDAAGAKVGAEFRVNTITGGDQQAAVDRDGGLRAISSSSGRAGYSAYSDVDGQRFDAQRRESRSASSPSTRTRRAISARPPSPSTPPATSSSSGEAIAQDGDTFGVFGQRFDASGAKVGSELSRSTPTRPGEQDYPAVAMDRAGNFVVVWTSLDGQDGSSTGIFGQRFNSARGEGRPRVPGQHVHDERAGRRLDRARARRRLRRGVEELRTGRLGLRRLRPALRPHRSAPADPSSRSTPTRPASRRKSASPRRRGSCRRLDEQGPGRRHLRHLRPAAGAPPRGLDRRRPRDRTSSDLNGVLEPGETVLVEPVWSNRERARDRTDRERAAHWLLRSGGTDLLRCCDATAAYGGMPRRRHRELRRRHPRTPATRFRSSGAAAGDALGRDARGGPRRPADRSIWTLHVGDSFSDVPAVAALLQEDRDAAAQRHHDRLHATHVLPRPTAVSRDQMAIFIAKGIAGLGELVPDGGLRRRPRAYDCSPGGHSLFTDVAPTDSVLPARALPRRPERDPRLHATQYCPGQAITRDAMASFIAKAIVAPGGGAAVPMTYSDPDHRPVLLLHAREPQPPLHRRAGDQSLLQAHPLPVGPGHRGRLHGDDVLPRRPSPATPWPSSSPTDSGSSSTGRKIGGCRSRVRGSSRASCSRSLP